MIKVISLLSILACTSGCATSEALTVANGEEPGTVLVSYRAESLDGAPISVSHMRRLAVKQCNLRDYARITPEVYVAGKCGSSDTNGACASWDVTKTYQCAGNAISKPDLPPATYPMAFRP